MRTQSASPMIYFPERIREALEFYQGVLGGELELYTVDETGTPGRAGPDDHVTFARLDADGVHIVAGVPAPASDGDTDPSSTGRDPMGVYLTIADEVRLTEVFDGLADGGAVNAPLSPRPWGRSGMLTDKFGTRWVISRS